MAFEFTFPDVGEGIHEGEIVKWRVKVGDEVKEDQPLVEMETAKAIVELPSPKAGTILAVLGKEGEVVHVGAILVVIGEKGEKWEPKAAASGPGVIGQIPTEEKGVVLPSRKSAAAQPAAHGAPVLPRIRQIADQLGVDINAIKGSGPEGQITEADLHKAKPASIMGGAISQPDFGKFGPVERVPLKSIRKAIAQHMVKSAFTIPHVTHMDEFDATALVALRESKKAEAEKRGIKLTFLACIVKAAVETLKKHPAVNAVFVDAPSGRTHEVAPLWRGLDDKTGQEIIYKKYYHIGIAVDTEDGLMVPVIKNADQKDVFQIAAEIAELAQKCRERKIGMEELQGGSFSITNIGSVGGLYATPIIPYGQTANLGVFRIKEKPVAENGKVIIKPILTLALSYDHRVVDGAEGARFMNDLIVQLS